MIRVAEGTTTANGSEQTLTTQTGLKRTWLLWFGLGPSASPGGSDTVRVRAYTKIRSTSDERVAQDTREIPASEMENMQTIPLSDDQQVRYTLEATSGLAIDWKLFSL